MVKVFIIKYGEIKLVTVKLLILHLVHQDILDQELSRNVLAITIIQVEISASVQNQHLFMDQLINHNPIFHTLQDTSFVYHSKFLQDLLLICHQRSMDKLLRQIINKSCRNLLW